jgi:predicted O-methyltransferase YrrM
MQNMIHEFVPPGHIYSVIPSIDNNYNKNEPSFMDLDFNEKSHKEILNEINHYLGMFDNTFGFEKNEDLQKNIMERKNNLQYTLMNGSFEWMDARLLYYFLQKNKTKRIIEVGSGISTLLMYNTKQMFHLDIEIICIEPYPQDYVKKLNETGKITLIEEKLENVDLNLFTTLNSNDILFIDSSHVLKVGSDVMYYFTKIFPILKKNVYIHIHDIFFPYDYPLAWLKQGRFWNEQYFLYVFLQYNTKFKIKFCNSYAVFKYVDQLRKIQENTCEVKNNMGVVFGGGSIWLTVEE